MRQLSVHSARHDLQVCARRISAARDSLLVIVTLKCHLGRVVDLSCCDSFSFDSCSSQVPFGANFLKGGFVLPLVFVAVCVTMEIIPYQGQSLLGLLSYCEISTF